MKSNFISKTTIRIILLLGISVICTFPKGANASAVAVGMGYPMVLGNEYQTYKPLTGYTLEGWVNAFGPNAQLYFSTTYQPLEVNRLENVVVRNYFVLAGLETKPQTDFFLQPFLSAGMGGAYSSLIFTEKPSASTNAAGSVIVQVRPGLCLSISDPVKLNVAFPLTWYLTRKLNIWGTTVALRVEL